MEEKNVKRLDVLSSDGHDPKRRYEVPDRDDGRDFEGRPGGKRLPNHLSRGSRHDPVPSRR